MLENETNPIIFSCQATGEPVPSISWYFKGVMINVSNASKYNVSNTLRETTVTSLLTITNANSFDVGTYTCQAENIIGIDQSSGVLTVNGKHCCDPNCDYIATYVHILSNSAVPYKCIYTAMELMGCQRLWSSMKLTLPAGFHQN